MNRFSVPAALLAALLLFAGCDAVSPAEPDLAVPASPADLSGSGDECDDDFGGGGDCAALVIAHGGVPIPHLNGHQNLHATFQIDAFRCLDDDFGGDDCDDSGSEEGGSLGLRIRNSEGDPFARLAVELTCVEVEDDTAWLAGEITAADGQATDYIGQGFFAKVVDNGEPGAGNDRLNVRTGLQYSVADAESDCRDRAGFGTLYALDSGNIEVNEEGSND
jgi:hypothetical protein